MSSKNIDHGTGFDNAEAIDPNVVGQNRGGAKIGKPNVPPAIAAEFSWVYNTKQAQGTLAKCVVLLGNHPTACKLAQDYDKNDAEAFAAIRKLSKGEGAKMFDSALKMYVAARALDKNWYMVASDETLRTLIAQTEAAWEGAKEGHKLGTISGEAKELIAEAIEAWNVPLVMNANSNWFNMKNNSQALFNQALQDASGGIRRALSGADWLDRAINKDDEPQIAMATNMLESGRHQKLLGLVQAISVSAVFDTLVTDERSYPLVDRIENGAREALRFEAYANAKKFRHPGVSVAETSAAKAGNSILKTDAIGGNI